MAGILYDEPSPKADMYFVNPDIQPKNRKQRRAKTARERKCSPLG
jgi:predicted adenine nucleotide alpha hydrolase (AANH) superfamily ATPase